MSYDSLRAAHSATERRPAVWPWLLMPLAALAMFVLLRSVRHATEAGAATGPGATLSDDSSDAPAP
jgi:hypothetical protein